MNDGFQWRKWIFRIVSYVLVAALASGGTYLVMSGRGYSKLVQLGGVLEKRFIGEANPDAMEDAAAAAMVDALGDRWSYYMNEEEYAAQRQSKKNSYVGVGITISKQENGFYIQAVEPEGPADQAGVRGGDVIIAVEGDSAVDWTVAQVKEQIQGEAGTQINVTLLRGETELKVDMTRAAIRVTVAKGTMLDESTGLVTITNFNENCAEQTLAAVEKLLEEGAQRLIFDVRNNGGGYLHELTNILNYLLPEGVLIQRVHYNGSEAVDESDAECLELPMAVLINGSTYSAAELFAAALSEFEWATLVGVNTTGKGYYQNTVVLSDGSAVNLSVGKYLTPKGVNLQEAGGLVPDVIVELTEEQATQLRSGKLDPLADPQVLAAMAALEKTEN